MVYFVATPIGNLSEITYRAVEVLSSCDIIMCEDTRHSKVLLDRYGINSKLVSYHKFNERSMVVKTIALAKEGKTIAVISDAGMPAINDPGNILILALQQEGIAHTVISGACAMVNAFVLSAFQPPFTYVGFLPDKNCDRVKLLDKVKDSGFACVVYVSVHDLEKDRLTLLQVLGDRRVAVCRELTKLHEEVIFSTLSQPLPQLKGEFVLVVDKCQDNTLTALTPLQHLQHHIDSGLDKNSAIKLTAQQRGVSKNEIYQLTVKK